MRNKFVNLFGTRANLAGALETTVTAGTTVLVTVFFVILVAYPEVGFAHPGFDRQGVELCAD
jgi:hypothetical protein